MELNKLSEYFDEAFNKYHGNLMLEDILDELVKIYESLEKEPIYQCNDMGDEWADTKEMTTGIKLNYLISQMNNILNK